MQTFGKRQYAHIELDPWARKKTQGNPASRQQSVPATRIAGYVVALVTVGVLAVAGFEILVLA